MSWSRLVLLAAALFVAAGLSGCFQPMYGEVAHPGLVEDVRAIEVAPVNTRFGHYFTEDLRTELNGTGQTTTAKYRLTVKLTTGVQTPTVNTEINVASSATVMGDADFALVRLSDNKEIFRDRATAAAAYDRTTQRYASMRAARDAELRLSRALAQEVAARVVAKLSAPAKPGEPTPVSKPAPATPPPAQSPPLPGPAPGPSTEQ